jgi:DNA polymerase III subunit delta'
MSLDSIRDQEVVLRFLRNMLASDRVPNGLLMWGPGGVGKRLAALELAKAVNCEGGEADACDTCLPCRKVAHGNHPDLRVVAPAKNTRLIDKDAVSEITEMASLRPYEGRWRVFVLQDADRMTPRAQNYFLKTLEEPPGRSLFLLVTEYPRMLLPTIRSRCQSLRFRSLRTETVVDLLKRERDLPDDLALSIANLAQGQMARALDLVDSDKRLVVLEVVRRLRADEDPVALAQEFAKSLELQRKQLEEGLKAEMNFDALQELDKDEAEKVKDEQLAVLNAAVKRDILEYLYLFETWYRDELVYGATADGARVLNRDQLPAFEAGVSTEASHKVAAVERAREYLDRYIQEERVFRDLFFALAEA